MILQLLALLIVALIISTHLHGHHAACHQCPPSSSSSVAAGEKLIFILAGQSNMAGRGGVSNNHWDGVIPPECHPAPSILRLTAHLQWEEAQDPLHADIDVLKTCGVGPGMAFANAVRSSSAAAVVIGLVPCAVGGTKITQWEKGQPLYDAMVRRATAAMGGSRVGALLWYQGESDTVHRADAEQYGRRMERLILDVRSDLGIPGMLVIQVRFLARSLPLEPSKMGHRLAADDVNSGVLKIRMSQQQLNIEKRLATATRRP